MNQGQNEPPRRRRRRRRRASDRAGRPSGPPQGGLSAIAEPRKLDLDRPVNEPLTPDEAREMSGHLHFLRTYKKQLGLSLNAAEDLLINGDREPTDRGICKHLLSKIDRRVVDKVLARDAMKTDARMRARFLAGIVRLNRDVSFLIWYLQALAEVTDKREAAAAFALTVDRIDFARLSNAQMADLLELIVRTFDGHERVQALFGLLGSETFEGALDRALGGLPDQLRDTFAPLRAAHRVVMRGAPHGDEHERALVEKGVATWLSAPDAVLRSYPLEVRTRLAEYAVHRLGPSSDAKGARSLLDSLPHDGGAYASLGLALAEQLIAAQKEDQARGVLSQIAQAHPQLRRARTVRDALAWPRAGRIAFPPPGEDRAVAKPGGKQTTRLRRAFWPERCAFVWVRLGPKGDRDRIVEEAKIQGGILLPGIAPALGHGAAGDDTMFVALEAQGSPLDRETVLDLELPDALSLALEGVSILRALALLGYELPDAATSRFLLADEGPPGLCLADLDGVVKGDPAACAVAHGKLARRFAADVLTHPNGTLRGDLPSIVRARLRDTALLPVLGRVLAEQIARSRDDSGSGV
jgi:hypothetical protein